MLTLLALVGVHTPIELNNKLGLDRVVIRFLLEASETSKTILQLDSHSKHLKHPPKIKAKQSFSALTQKVNQL